MKGSLWLTWNIAWEKRNQQTANPTTIVTTTILIVHTHNVVIALLSYLLFADGKGAL